MNFILYFFCLPHHLCTTQTVDNCKFRYYLRLWASTFTHQQLTDHFFPDENPWEEKHLKRKQKQICNLAVVLLVMHMPNGLLSFLRGELMTRRTIRNKQLVGPTSHVFNLFFSLQPGMSNRIRTYHLRDITKQKRLKKRHHNSICVLQKSTLVIISLRCPPIMCRF